MLAVILLLGSLLRFYDLGSESPWYDELLSWRRSSYDSVSDVFHRGARAGVHPPGYLVFLHFWQKCLGDSESVLRLPSALCGVLCILIIFVLGARLYSRREGLIAAALMAVLWSPIYYSQDARPYSLLLLSTMLAACFWIPIVRGLRLGKNPSYVQSAGYVATAMVSSYLHYFGLYFVILQCAAALLLLVRRPRALLKLVPLYLPVVAVYLPWLPALAEDLRIRRLWIAGPTPSAVSEYLGFLFNDSRLVAVVLVVCCVALGRTLYDLVRRRGYDRVTPDPLSPGFLLAMWLVVPFLGAYAKSYVSAPVLTSRNLIISLPAAYLLAARSVTRLPVPKRGQAIAVTLLVGVALSHLLFGLDYYSEPQKEQFREAVCFIGEHDPRDSDSVLVAWGAYLDQFDCYSEKAGSAKRVDVAAGRDDDVVPVIQYIALRNPRYMWYVLVHSRALV